MPIRTATRNDIPKIQVVRHAVKENRLSNPNLVTDEDCRNYLEDRGKGWVSLEDDKLIAFAIVDLQDHNVWALFVHPDSEKRGHGRQLHDKMLNWYFEHSQHSLWLSTSAGTRAETFYKKAGWTEVGPYGKGEIKFEMSQAHWTTLNPRLSSRL